MEDVVPPRKIAVFCVEEKIRMSIEEQIAQQTEQCWQEYETARSQPDGQDNILSVISTEPAFKPIHPKRSWLKGQRHLSAVSLAG